MAMKLNKIHHIAIICSDYEKSKHFYTEILGFPIINEAFRAERKSYKLDLRVGEIQIELFSFPNPPARASYPENCGLRHLAFSVSNLDKIIEELKQKEILCEAVRIDPITNRRFTFFSDPDNLPLEIYEE